MMLEEPLIVALLGQPINAPEISIIAEFLRRHIEESYESQIQPALAYLNRNSDNVQLGLFHHALKLIGEVAIIIRTQQSPELSIDQIIDSLTKENVSYIANQTNNTGGDVSFSRANLSSVHRNKLRQAVFSCIGYITLLYLPKYNGPGSSLAINVQIHPTRRVPSTSVTGSQASRRIQGLLKNFGELFPEPSTPTNGERTIYRSKLDYFTLHRLSNVKIKWVDVLSMHLEFDSSTKELALFRLPSFCLFQSRRLSGENAFHCALMGFNSMNLSGNTSKKATQIFLNEIILSYRLLFGQDRRSRSLFRTVEFARTFEQGVQDPLLMSLCGKKRFNTARYDVPWTIHQRNFYDAQEDFPLLGSRLLQLQEFSTRQDPSTLREFWADRRNPFNFWTFWAVLIIGAISILLSIVQCALNFAQVAISATQGRIQAQKSNCDC
ncbi:hypothetical protein K449DRAFT_401205 [Hypoxylon sp. EC38]|nr:hypothetical protein K449DRAFT_401205 [Hypoxylon sp. EC38]